jgi:hypothetical protein
MVMTLNVSNTVGTYVAKWHENNNGTQIDGLPVFFQPGDVYGRRKPDYRQVVPE